VRIFSKSVKFLLKKTMEDAWIALMMNKSNLNVREAIPGNSTIKMPERDGVLIAWSYKKLKWKRNANKRELRGKKKRRSSRRDFLKKHVKRSWEIPTSTMVVMATPTWMAPAINALEANNNNKNRLLITLHAWIMKFRSLPKNIQLSSCHERNLLVT